MGSRESIKIGVISYSAGQSRDIEFIEGELASSVGPHHIRQMPFNGLGLSDTLLKTLDELGFEKPTPVQEKSIPLILKGKDIIASAQTGTGKTAAFGLPTLDRLSPGKRIQCLILEPTRELAQQVEEALKSYSKHLDTRIGVVYGLSLIHLCRCRRTTLCRSRWSPNQ